MKDVGMDIKMGTGVRVVAPDIRGHLLFLPKDPEGGAPPAIVEISEDTLVPAGASMDLKCVVKTDGNLNVRTATTVSSKTISVYIATNGICGFMISNQ